MGVFCYKTMQMDDSPETSELLTFAATAEARSISKAARTLGVPRPTVSRRLARLEEKLGVRLLRRTTRTMALTDAGEVLYARARVVLAAVRDAVASVQMSDDVVRGLVRVSVPVMAAASLGRLVSSFLAQHPAVRLEIHATTRHVDLLAEGFDAAIRASAALPPGVIARNLVRSRRIAVASPTYLQRVGAPTKTADLSKHTCLSGFACGEHPATEWPLLRGGAVHVEPTLMTNDVELLRAAALAGRGVALLPLLLVGGDLESGSLVAVLPERIGTEVHVAVFYAERELLPPAVRAFVNAAILWARDEPMFTRQLPSKDGQGWQAPHGPKPPKKRPSRARRP